MENMTFNAMKAKHLTTLAQYVPIVDRVHGTNHPEFHEVRALAEDIIAKSKKVRTRLPDVAAEFSRLREVTDNYRVPGDVCESYEAVYTMLADLDKAYSGR